MVSTAMTGNAGLGTGTAFRTSPAKPGGSGRATYRIGHGASATTVSLDTRDYTISGGSSVQRDLMDAVNHADDSGSRPTLAFPASAHGDPLIRARCPAAGAPAPGNATR